MPNFVRVKLEDGSEASVPESYAKSRGFAVIEKDATDASGRALPPKSKTSKGRAAKKAAPAKKTAAKKTAAKTAAKKTAAPETNADKAEDSHSSTPTEGLDTSPAADQEAPK